jgi:Na+/H+ antiporter NhaC
MRVFDLSLPETQTQLLSKIESNSYMIMILYILSIVLLTGKGGGQLTHEHKWCGEGKKYPIEGKIQVTGEAKPPPY